MSLPFKLRERVAVACPYSFLTTALYSPSSADVTCEISIDILYIPDCSIMLVVMRRSLRFTGLEFNKKVTVGAGFAVSSDSSITEPDSVRRMVGCFTNLGADPFCRP